MTPIDRAEKAVEEYGFPYRNYSGLVGLIEQAIIAAVADEREACAQIADDKCRQADMDTHYMHGMAHASAMAADIRDAINRRARATASTGGEKRACA